MALTDKLRELANSIREKTGTTEPLTIDQMSTMVKEIEDMPNTIVLVDENGNEFPAVLTEETVTLTATANDIRKGSVAVTSDGVIEGTKEIPVYYTTEGVKIITSGKDFEVRIDGGRHEYTKLQALFCVFDTSASKSVATDRVAIATSVYPVNSSEAIATVTTKSENSSIHFGLTNDSGNIYVIRYFTYKEEY